MEKTEAGVPPQEPHEIPIDGIVNAVGRYYGYTAEELFGPDREDSALSDARAVMFTLLADNTPLLNRQIAELAERASVSQVIRRVRHDAEEDPEFKEHLETLAKAAAGEPLGDTPASWTHLVEGLYGMSVDEISTSRSFRALEARQILTHLLVKNTVLRRRAIARRTGYASAVAVSNALGTLETRRQDDPAFAKRLARLEEGEMPERGLTEDEAFDRITSYYGIGREDITGADRQERYMKPRMMAMYVMTRGVGYNYEEAARVMGRSGHIRDQVHRFEESLENDERLKAEANYLLDPEGSPRPPYIPDILRKVSESYRIDPSELRQPGSDRARTAKRMAVHILGEELSMSRKDIAQVLDTTIGKVRWYQRRSAQEIAENPKLILEIDALKPANSVSITPATRIIRHISRRCHVQVDQIPGTDQTPEVNKARRFIVTLMQYAGYPAETVAEMLEMPLKTVVELTNGSLARLSGASTGNGAQDVPVHNI